MQNITTPIHTNGCGTDAFAARNQVKAASVRVRLCQTGSYFGIRPQKLPNGRLVWPVDNEQQLTDRGDLK